MKMKRLAFLLFSIVFLAGCSDYDQDGNTTSEKAKQKYDVAINQVFKSENQYLKKQQVDRQLKRNTVKRASSFMRIKASLKSITTNQLEEKEPFIRKTDQLTRGKHIRNKSAVKSMTLKKKYLENIGIK